jgi:hypothetical protein
MKIELEKKNRVYLKSIIWKEGGIKENKMRSRNLRKNL